MKVTIRSLVLGAGLAFTTIAFGDLGDDTAWIKRCTNEIESENNTIEVVNDWCKCMNEEIAETEKPSILAWYKTPAGLAAYEKCASATGWKLP